MTENTTKREAALEAVQEIRAAGGTGASDQWLWDEIIHSLRDSAELSRVNKIIFDVETWLSDTPGETINDKLRFLFETRQKLMAEDMSEGKGHFLDTPPHTIYVWQQGDDEPVNGMFIETQDPINLGVKYVRASLATPAVPDGWMLVPIEPTDRMLDAAEECEIIVYEDRNCKDHYGHGHPKDVYAAMLSAAPKQDESVE